jgi:hypothetical protein
VIATDLAEEQARATRMSYNFLMKRIWTVKMCLLLVLQLYQVGLHVIFASTTYLTTYFYLSNLG